MGCNTVQMREISEAAKREGTTFTLEALAHVQPLHFKPVIVNGICGFSWTAPPKR
jgi:ethanolamine ammonia-lyase large subunit